MSEELKPCPCGGLVYVGSYKFIDATLSGIGCMHCGRTTGMTEAKSDAIAAWNRRASSATEGEGEAHEAAKRIVTAYNAANWRPVEGTGNSQTAYCAEAVASAIVVARALLSSPDARREALEEAAKKLEDLAIDYEERAEVSATERHYSTAAYQKRESNSLLHAAHLVRALKETKP